MHNRNPLCKLCSFEIRSKKCFACGKPISTSAHHHTSGSEGLQALGREWHVSCFPCSVSLLFIKRISYGVQSLPKVMIQRFYILNLRQKKKRQLIIKWNPSSLILRIWKWLTFIVNCSIIVWKSLNFYLWLYVATNVVNALLMFFFLSFQKCSKPFADESNFLYINFDPVCFSCLGANWWMAAAFDLPSAK